MPTTIGGKQVMTTASNHSFISPPAVSNIPPMTPAKPDGAPAPFPYTGRTATAAGVSKKLKVGGGWALVEQSSAAIDPPGNQASQPAPIHDLVTMQVNAKMHVK